MGAAARLTRFVTSDKLGGWILVDPAKRWAWRYEERAMLRDNAPSDWENGVMATWQAKLVSGLDCPFCVGFWITLAVIVADKTLPEYGPTRTAFTTACSALAANYVIGHVSARLDD